MTNRIAFYTDGHVPLAVVSQARAKVSDIKIIRCEEVGLKDADDEIHWEYALRHRYVLITADRGFLARAIEANQQGKDHPGIIFITPHMQGEPCIGPLVELLIFLHEAIKAEAATLEHDVNNRIEYIS